MGDSLLSSLDGILFLETAEELMDDAENTELDFVDFFSDDDLGEEENPYV